MKLCLIVLGAFFISSLALGESGSQIVAGHARFTVITQSLIRLEYSEKSQFVDAPSLFAMDRNARYEGAQITQGSGQVAGQIIIDTGLLILTYNPDGKNFSEQNIKIIIKDFRRGEITWLPSMKNQKNLGGTAHSLDDSEGPVPVGEGLLSRDGWYVLDDSKRFLIDHKWVASRPTGSGTDWYFFGYGDDYKKALKDLTTIGGAVPMPRRYVLGSWYSRWWPYTSQDYRKIVGEYHEHGFPLDVLVMDMDWHKRDNFTGYTWDRKLFPDAEDYLKWIHDQHLFATLNDHPQGSVGPYEAHYNEFMTAMGADSSKKEVLGYNSGDEKYLKNVFKFMHEPNEKMGVDFWWLDWLGDTEYPFNDLAWANEFYYTHSRQNGLRGQQFSRWADWGDHRHPIHFSGDSVISWKTLKFQVPFTATSGNVGLFFWTHDMGGFEGLRNSEALARWVQFGAFSAALRLHSINKWYLDKRPWKYSTRIENSMREAFHLRSEFFPYTYSRVAESTQDSVPLLRPLYIEHSRVQGAYENSQEYLYGRDVLVAPIVEKGKALTFEAAQKVWFPPGIWYDWFSGLAYSGGTTKTFSHGINSFPLFIRGGIPLTLQPYSERMTTDPLKTLVVRVYPGENDVVGKSQLYEDDGLTEEYMKGRKAITSLSYIHHDNEMNLTIAPTVGVFKDQLLERSYILEFFGVGKSGAVTVNGVGFPSHYDKTKGILKIEIPAQDIRQGENVHIVF